ncbi:hypothetical protein NT6N_24380 [Oceaniferula spumae]|uniref:DUF2007 domain-containing protein n=1 Tax=Oceaniferula spumae TaxID=2979115 RepID=A0AAT9FN62_9BACT
MRKIFESIDFARVGLLQSILESEGIGTLVKNYDLAATAGVIAASDCYPELWIIDEAKFEQAERIIESYNSPAPESGSTWICFTCKNEVDSNFDACWNCSVPRPKKEKQT